MKRGSIDTCNVTAVSLIMIRSFRHGGLEEFFLSGSKKGILPDHAAKLARILDRLDASKSPQDMRLPGLQMNPLVGNESGTFAVSVSVNGNWRVTFQFEGEDAIVVDYRDYH